MNKIYHTTKNSYIQLTQINDVSYECIMKIKKNKWDPLVFSKYGANFKTEVLYFLLCLRRNNIKIDQSLIFKIINMIAEYRHPGESPYAGGIFKFDINSHKMKVILKTKIWHPNLTCDACASVFIIKKEEFVNIHKLIEEIENFILDTIPLTGEYYTKILYDSCRHHNKNYQEKIKTRDVVPIELDDIYSTNTSNKDAMFMWFNYEDLFIERAREWTIKYAH